MRDFIVTPENTSLDGVWEERRKRSAERELGEAWERSPDQT